MIASDLLDFNFYQNILTVIIFIFSYIILFYIGANKKSDIKIISFLYVWHTFFSVVYYLYSLSNPADAKAYYLRSLRVDGFEFKVGTSFVNQFTSVFTQGLDASYLNTTLIFNLFGSAGLMLFYLSLKKYFTSINKFWIFILFIPSMSFWSAGLGKDSISFFLVCLFLYALAASRRQTILVSISFFAMLLIRPHISLMMLVSYIIYFIIQARIRLIFKILTIPAIGAAIFFSIGFVQQYAGLEDASLDGVSDYVDQRQGYNQGGGSSLDIASMSYPMQMFTYIFRPLPFEAHSMVALVTSIENTILLLLFIYILLKSRFNYKPFFKNKNLWLFMYVFLTCTILALTTANLGIATRQKWMFMPILIYLLVYSFYQYRTNNERATL